MKSKPQALTDGGVRVNKKPLPIITPPLRGGSPMPGIGGGGSPSWRSLRTHVAAWTLLALPIAALGESTALERKCDALYRLTDASHSVQPGITVPAQGTTPAHCRVAGVIDGAIRFAVAMPNTGWAGRLMYHAPGGLAGQVGDHTGLLHQGFAMATTDTGHESDNDPSFYRDDHAKLNFAFRANHLVTALAKRLIAAYYGRPVEHAYLWGCSNGGRAALVEALRYPEDFDGIIAGAPAIDYEVGLLTWALENSRRQAANPLTPESLELLDANSQRACDGLDGLRDGIIADPRQCTLDKLQLEALACGGDQTAGCLTPGQIDTARYNYTGILNDQGEAVVPGVYPGAEAAGDWRLWVTGEPSFDPDSASTLTARVIAEAMHRVPGFALEQFDVLQDREALRQAMVGLNPPTPDFSEFQARGGKLIIYSGWHDMPCRAKVLEQYLEEAESIHGQAELDSFLRTYLVPGKIHCVGGPGAWVADYVEPLVAWVEDGKPPGALVSHHPGIVDWFESMAVAAFAGVVNWHGSATLAGAEKPNARKFTRPQCPYPQYAKYTGSGDPNDAANFTCTH